MLFKLETVTSCPITRASQGKILLKAWIVEAIRQCLIKEKGEEWLIVLTGTRSQDGLLIECDGVVVPEVQKRSSANVTIDEMDVDYDKGYVCVLHSHHSMGAFFSGTDNTRLNPKFPSSIVVSTRIESVNGVHLGFEYKAEGKVLLPCGQLGIVPMLVEVGDIESWPRTEPRGMATHESLPYSDKLDGCNKLTQAGDEIYWKQQGTLCGVKRNEEIAVTPMITFPEGFEVMDISAQLPPASWGGFYRQGQGGTYTYQQGVGLVAVPDKSLTQAQKEGWPQGKDSHQRGYYNGDRQAWGDYYDDWDDSVYPLIRPWLGETKEAKGPLEIPTGGLKDDAEMEAEADDYLAEEFAERRRTIEYEWLMEREEAFERANPGIDLDTEVGWEQFEDWLAKEDLKAEMVHDMALAAQMGSEKD